MDDKTQPDKFEPMTNIKPKFGINDEDQINLKEKESEEEPKYLDEKGEIPPEKPSPVEEPDPTEPVKSESTANYATFSSDEKPKRDYKKPLVIALAVVILGAALAYWFVLKPKPATITPTATSSSSTTSSSATSTEATTTKATTTKITATTKSYTSPNFNLAFSYPDDWVVADAGGGIMTVKSPSISLKNGASQIVTGSIVFTIRDKAQKLTEFDSGNATATRDSLKISYVKPTQTQRGSTYVSYLQYATDGTTGALDGLYITGDNGYAKGQAIPMVDIQKVDPIISISFLDSTSKAMSIADIMMSDATFADPLTAILKSLAIN